MQRNTIPQLGLVNTGILEEGEVMRDEEINQNSFIYLLYTVDFYRSRAYPENTGCATGIHQSITAPCTPNRAKRQFTFNPTADIFRDWKIHTKST